MKKLVKRANNDFNSVKAYKGCSCSCSCGKGFNSKANNRGTNSVVTQALR